MPANQTPNLQLCQWEPDDEVLRTDFNADNAKIDAAAAELTQRVDELSVLRELVFSQTPEAGTTLIHIPLTGLDRSKWRRMVLYARLYSPGHAYMDLNNQPRPTNTLICYGSEAGTTEHFAMLFCAGSGASYSRMEFDLCAPQVCCQYYSHNGNSAGRHAIAIDRGYTWSQVTELTISSPGLTSGSRIELWAEQ